MWANGGHCPSLAKVLSGTVTLLRLAVSHKLRAVIGLSHFISRFLLKRNEIAHARTHARFLTCVCSVSWNNWNMYCAARLTWGSLCGSSLAHTWFFFLILLGAGMTAIMSDSISASFNPTVLWHWANYVIMNLQTPPPEHARTCCFPCPCRSESCCPSSYRVGDLLLLGVILHHFCK